MNFPNKQKTKPYPIFLKNILQWTKVLNKVNRNYQSMYNKQNNNSNKKFDQIKIIKGSTVKFKYT